MLQIAKQVLAAVSPDTYNLEKENFWLTVAILAKIEWQVLTGIAEELEKPNPEHC